MRQENVSPIIVFRRDTALPTHDFILLQKNVIGVQLIYNIVLVSSVQQSKLVIRIYIYTWIYIYIVDIYIHFIYIYIHSF